MEGERGLKHNREPERAQQRAREREKERERETTCAHNTCISDIILCLHVSDVICL